MLPPPGLLGWEKKKFHDIENITGVENNIDGVRPAIRMTKKRSYVESLLSWDKE